MSEAHDPLEFESLPASDGEAYRRLARHWAASVTVVTVRHRAGSTHGAPAYDGFTATAFLTVSIDPPIVLVSATNVTRALAMLRGADAFAVNLLSSPQRELAEAFSTPHELRDDLFARFAWSPDAHGTPLLSRTLGAFSARVRELVEAGDHTLCLGDVTALHAGAPGDALVYQNRRYGTVTFNP